jgi:porin
VSALTAALWLAAPGSAHATEGLPGLPTNPVGPDSATTGHEAERESWRHRRYLLGDWGGARRWLGEQGITARIIYTVDLIGNPAGGDPQYKPFSAFGNLGVALQVDSEKAGGWRGGKLTFHVRNLAGDGNRINKRLFSPFDPVSDLSVSRTTQVSDLFFSQELWGDEWVIKIGKQDASADFSASNVSGAFLNAGISPAANVPLPAFPDPSLGLVLLGKVTPHIGFATGVFGSEFDGNAMTDSGLFRGHVFGIAQVRLATQLAAMPGATTFGAWHRNAPPPTNYAGPKEDGAYGLYLLIDQTLFRERPGSGYPEGLSAFFQISWTPPDRSNFDLWVGGGLVYQGIIPGRPRDRFGIAAVRAGPSPTYARQGFSREVVVECFYEWRVTRWLRFRPDVQYFSRPAGTPNDALAVGLRTMIDF